MTYITKVKTKRGNVYRHESPEAPSVSETGTLYVHDGIFDEYFPDLWVSYKTKKVD